MNLYGFAGSDQVNNSDPFGLCPILEWRKCKTLSVTAGASTGGLGAEVKLGPVQGKVGVLNTSAAATHSLTFSGIETSLSAKVTLVEAGASAGDLSAKLSIGCKQVLAGAGQSGCSAGGGVGAKEGDAKANVGSGGEVGWSADVGAFSVGVSLDLVETATGSLGAANETLKSFVDAMSTAWKSAVAGTSVVSRPKDK